MKSFITPLLALASIASAHFTLDYPQTRGFDEDLEPNFCGGFNSSATRVPFPLAGGPILIDSHHPSADVAILISFVAAPTTFKDFNTTSTGATYGLLKQFGTITGEGEFCFNVDIAALNVAGVGNGSIATIQVEFNGGDGELFQCSDVILSSTFQPTNVSCVNATGTSTTSASTSASATGSTGAAAATTGASSAAGSVRATLAGAVLALAGAVAMVL